MNEKNNLAGKLILSAVLLVCGLVANYYLPDGGLVWHVLTVVSRLAAMLGGLMLVSCLCALLLHRMDPKSSRGRTMFTLANSALRYLLVIAGLLWGLSICGVDIRALLAGAGVVALIIGFGAESLIADVITGIFMLFEHQYEVGDIIVVGDFRGTVTNIGVRTTSITDAGGNVKIINNSDIRSLINRSSGLSVVVCDIGIPYTGYLKRAEAVLHRLLPTLKEQHPDLFTAEPRYVGVEQMDVANDAVFLRVTAEVAETDLYTAQRTLNRELLMAFEEDGIPNPVAELSLKRD